MENQSRAPRIAAGVLLVLGAVSVPVAVGLVEIEQAVTDADLIVATAGPLARDPAFQTMIADAISTPVVDAVRENLPWEIPDLEPMVSSVVDAAVTSDLFPELWDRTLRTSHAHLMSSLTGAEDALFVLEEDGTILLRVQPVIEAGRERLVASGVPLAERIPDVNQEVVLSRSDLAAQAPGYLDLLDRAATVTPWVSVVLLAGALLIPGHRLARLAVAGLLVALLSGGIAIALGWGGIVLGAAAHAWASPATVEAGFAGAAGSLLSALWWTSGAGLIVTVVAGIGVFLTRPRR